MLDRTALNHRTDRRLQRSGNFRLLLVSLLAAVIGLVAGGVAYLVLTLIAILSNLFFYQRFSTELPNILENPLGPGLLLVTVGGGLVIGLMGKYGTPKIRGHGIPEAMEAVLFNRSRIAPRVAFWKPVSAAIAIGTGGPFGAEGPIIQTGGAIGSLVGQFLHTTAAERKVLLACGAAAGMAATFSTPIAAVILAIELLLFEFKSRSFIPLVIASTIATSVHFILFGRGPLFVVEEVTFGIPGGIPFFVILGLLCGLAAVSISAALYRVEDLFERLPLDPMWWPAIGGLVLGLIGLFVPRVLGVGYETITAILNNDLSLSVLVAVMIFKLVAMIVTLSSGTSGGLLAPMFMSSAAMGALFAHGVNAILPGASLDPGAYAVVAMAAVFGAASRATFAFIIFAFEITRDYNAILPLMLTSVIADGVALFFMRHSIMTEKLAQRGLVIPQEYEVDVLQQTRVGDVMATEVPTLPRDMPVRTLAERIAGGDPLLTRHHGLPIVDGEGHLVGIITRSDLLRTMEEDQAGERTVLEAGSDTLIVTYPDELLHLAIAKMLQYDIGRLPVVSREKPSLLVGYLGRSGVLQARVHRLEEESVRETGWIARFPVLPHRWQGKE